MDQESTVRVPQDGVGTHEHKIISGPQKLNGQKGEWVFAGENESHQNGNTAEKSQFKGKGKQVPQKES